MLKRRGCSIEIELGCKGGLKQGDAVVAVVVVVVGKEEKEYYPGKGYPSMPPLA